MEKLRKCGLLLFFALPTYSKEWDMLDFTCSGGSTFDPVSPLIVNFTQITHYTSQANCGNLILESDLHILTVDGGYTIPEITYKPGYYQNLYTFMMIDPDANDDCSWPDCGEPGDHAPVRHYLLGNIPGEYLSIGGGSSVIEDNSELLTPFKAPTPGGGSHRYGLFLFLQPGGRTPIEFAPLNNSVIIQWDYADFIDSYDLSEPIASNWFIAQHDMD